MNSDEIGMALGDILVDMIKAKTIIMGIDVDYDIIRTDRNDKGITHFYESDKHIQDTLMSLTGAIIYIKHEINMLDGEE